MQPLGHVEVVQFLAPVVTIFFDLFADLIVYVLVPEPHDEAGHGVLLGKSDGLEDDAQQGQADASARTRPKGAGRGMQPSVAFARGVEFLQQVLDALRQVGDAACGRAVGEFRIRPQSAQHLDQVGLARPVEATHPDGWLLGLVNVLEIGLEDVRQTFFILAVADESLQFVTEHGKGLFGPLVVDIGHSLIDKLPG